VPREEYGRCYLLNDHEHYKGKNHQHDDHSPNSRNNRATFRKPIVSLDALTRKPLKAALQASKGNDWRKDKIFASRAARAVRSVIRVTARARNGHRSRGHKATVIQRSELGHYAGDGAFPALFKRLKRFPLFRAAKACYVISTPRDRVIAL
jgi:hypothetical protein